jgi:hypothetical protein
MEDSKIVSITVELKDDDNMTTTFWNDTPYRIPVEYKIDSFGKLNGKIVAVDYGS